MSRKKGAPLTAATVQQGFGSFDEDNLRSESLNFKSDISLYLSNTFLRFRLLRVAQDLLVAREIVRPNSNFAKCHRSTLSSIVSLVRNPRTFRAYFNHVVTCANPFLCPVCSPRIMGVRRTEISKAVHSWLSLDSSNTCYMFTFTFSHSRSDALSGLLEAFKSSLQRFWSRGDLKRLLNAAGRVGRITATEIQYSRKNGWHPHQHVLLFCRVADFDQLKLASFWLGALESSGLSGLSDVAFDLVEARSCEAYLTKISSELALGNFKEGRAPEHFSPFQLLREASSSRWAADSFCELFSSTRCIHSLTWSRGLKSYFGISEVSDESITEGLSQPELEGFLDLVSDVYRSLSMSDRAFLRNCAALNDRDKALSFLSQRLLSSGLIGLIDPAVLGHA